MVAASICSAPSRLSSTLPTPSSSSSGNVAAQVAFEERDKERRTSNGSALSMASGQRGGLALYRERARARGGCLLCTYCTSKEFMRFMCCICMATFHFLLIFVASLTRNDVVAWEGQGSQKGGNATSSTGGLHVRAETGAEADWAKGSRGAAGATRLSLEPTVSFDQNNLEKNNVQNSYANDHGNGNGILRLSRPTTR